MNKEKGVSFAAARTAPRDYLAIKESVARAQQHSCNIKGPGSGAKLYLYTYLPTPWPIVFSETTACKSLLIFTSAA